MLYGWEKHKNINITWSLTLFLRNMSQNYCLLFFLIYTLFNKTVLYLFLIKYYNFKKFIWLIVVYITLFLSTIFLSAYPKCCFLWKWQWKKMSLEFLWGRIWERLHYKLVLKYFNLLWHNKYFKFNLFYNLIVHLFAYYFLLDYFQWHESHVLYYLHYHDRCVIK